MNLHEQIVLNEIKLKSEVGERRGKLEAALTDYRRSQPSLRERAATLLVALADRLSPEAVVASKEGKTFHHA